MLALFGTPQTVPGRRDRKGWQGWQGWQGLAGVSAGQRDFPGEGLTGLGIGATGAASVPAPSRSVSVKVGMESGENAPLGAIGLSR